jgi:hypothetical protein
MRATAAEYRVVIRSWNGPVLPHAH